MKKICLLIIILFLPIIVSAKNDLPEQEFVETFNFNYLKRIRSTQKRYGYGYHYENGMYYLENSSYYTSINGSGSIMYTCNSLDISCETLTVIDPNTDYVGYCTTFDITNGEQAEDYLYFKTSTQYKKEGNMYKLINPEDILVTRRTSYREDYLGKFFCADRSDECEELLYIEEMDPNKLLIHSTKNEYVFGKGFDYINGNYVLKDIETNWPDYENNVGMYTCLSKYDTCAILYHVQSFEKTRYSLDDLIITQWDSTHYEGTIVDLNTKSIEIGKDQTKDIEEYLEDSSTIWIENEELLKIEDNKIIPLKTGKTTVLIQRQEDIVLLHITITETNMYNPKTGTNLCIPLLLIVLEIITMHQIIKKHKKRER